MRKTRRKETDKERTQTPQPQGRDPSTLEEQPGKGPGYLAALGSRWQEAGAVYPARGSVKTGEKKVLETTASGRDGVMKAQGRNKGGGEERKRKRREKKEFRRGTGRKKRIQEEMQRRHQTVLWRERIGQTRTVGKTI